MKKFFYWFSCFVLVLSLFSSCSKPSTKVPPVAVAGVLDLRDWDFKVDGIVKLDGEWEFYWNQLIQSEKISETKKEFVQFEKNNGFIDKYIGDAIMALFSDSLEDAIQTSLEIHHTLVQVNKRRAQKGYSPIEVGIGINVGILMLGIIGESERMESTVISDVVNVASRVEGLCKIFDTSILITEFAYLRLRNKNLFPIRYVGKSLVKGKDEELKVYEVIDPTNEEVAQKKILTKEIFETAVRYFENYKFEEAKINFQKVLELNPNDKTAQYYLSLTER